MKISTRGRYGLRAMVDLASHQDDKAIPLRVIAERENISEQYLEQLFASLRKSGLVASVRGAHGGYLLNRKPEDITAGDIFRVLEGPVSPVNCVQEDYKCEHSDECASHDLWNVLSEQIEEVLDSHSLADLAKKAEKLKKN
ncbi:MAG: RrF2 family transcriptional regulator [Bacillota bacterium]